MLTCSYQSKSHFKEKEEYFFKMIQIGVIILTFIFLYFCNYIVNWKFYSAGEKFPGPRWLPILGNSLDFATNSHGIFVKFMEFSKKYNRFFRVWNQGKLYVVCCKHKDAEVLLSSNTFLHKSESYKFLLPWIGQGLISSSVIPQWRKHRKIITPTFHFKILQDFLEVFNRNAQILCDELACKINKGPFDVYNHVKLMALDNICETAMGINVNAQKNSESAYVKAVKDITNIVTLRFFKVWLMVDVLFNLSNYAKIQKKALEILHGTTRKLIKEKREQYKDQSNESNEQNSFEETYNEKKKMAFLNLLLKSEEGSQLSDKEIREEVDTFMFAGHDTISSGISLVLFCLGKYPDIQEKVYNEQISIMGNSDKSPTYSEIQEMKYLELVIKEVERLYPSVPIIGRALMEDLQLPGNYIVPKGSQLCIDIFTLHRDPEVWPNPEKFDPDNFLPEAIQNRSPYAYIPFSAGPRNCIGQKYAMLAMKATVSIICRRYKIFKSPKPEDELKLTAEIVLLSNTGFKIQIEPRK